MFQQVVSRLQDLWHLMSGALSAAVDVGVKELWKAIIVALLGAGGVALVFLRRKIQAGRTGPMPEGCFNFLLADLAGDGRDSSQTKNGYKTIVQQFDAANPHSGVRAQRCFEAL